MKRGHVIFLNGVSSAGKSTLSWELQAQCEEEYYWLSNDAFTDMPHNSYYERNWDKTFTTAITMLYKTVMLYVENGLNVVVDHVLLYKEDQGLEELIACVEMLKDAHVTFVFVSCPLTELNRRELARGDREIGQAKGQYEKLFPENLYDIVVDTCANTTAQCATQIIDRQKLLIERGEETAFERIYRDYLE